MTPLPSDLRLTFYGPQRGLAGATKPAYRGPALGRGCGKSKFLLLLCWLLVAQWDGVFRTHGARRSIRGVRIIF